MNHSFISTSSLLSGLNPAQLQAVTSDPAVSVQILAGPGSGKTKVLTSRIAYLILSHSMPPSSICAVTFTNKAAKEMRERLKLLIGDRATERVKMGTFHALCANFLRKYGNLIGLNLNFTICDAEESKKVISTLLKPVKDFLEQKDSTLKDGTILSMISKAKAKHLTPAEFSNLSYARDILKIQQSDEIISLIADIYENYERRLRTNNSLDFDDLLVFGVKLFKQHERTVSWCRHLFVDEFQDTNRIQYELVTALVPDQCLTVVGDPDQSIYGWRSAEVENIVKMRKSFPSTQQIFLEQNYRSTASILNASLAIIIQDKERIQKSLLTSHPVGPTPVLRFLPDEKAEASFIAREIKRVVTRMEGIVRWGDFAILLRFIALSRTIESALQKEGIPSRILGGHKFFDRVEIKTILAYLQLVDNPDFDPAFSRTVNIPPRGIGEKSLFEIAERAAAVQKSQLAFVEGVCDGMLPDIKLAVKTKLRSFVKIVRTLSNLAKSETPPADLIRYLLDQLQYQDFLRRTQPDWESRWENVQELITFASEVTDEFSNAGNSTASQSPKDNTDANVETPLRLFLQASMLSTENNYKRSNDNNEKVTITTCHAAKGLEWPVVLIPSVESGTFPFYRSDDVEEERFGYDSTITSALLTPAGAYSMSLVRAPKVCYTSHL